MQSSTEHMALPAEDETMSLRPTRVELLSCPGIEPDDPMSEAGRKVFRFHYRKMLFHEPGTRLGEDIEALHDMRVATRRMRAALRVFGGYYTPKARTRFRKGLQRTGRALGPVRDLDVFRAKIEKYQVTLPEIQQAGLDPFLHLLEAKRDKARERMIHYLDGEPYARFVERFGRFTETEEQASRRQNQKRPTPYRVCHVAPVAIYTRLAAVQAYGEWVIVPEPPPDLLHRLRISCKRLRYTLEFFSEVLGPTTQSLIKEIVTVQDHLGSLQDAVVAGAILREYLQQGTWGQGPMDETVPGAPEDTVGVEAYLATRESEQRSLIETFPEAWQRIVSHEFSQRVAESVAVL